jgi:hypothetical protein
MKNFEAEEGADYFLHDDNVCSVYSGTVKVIGENCELRVSPSEGNRACGEVWAFNSKAETTQPNAVAKAMVPGAFVCAWYPGTKVEAWANGAIARAMGDGCVAISCAGGAIAYGWPNGKVIQFGENNENN